MPESFQIPLGDGVASPPPPPMMSSDRLVRGTISSNVSGAPGDPFVAFRLLHLVGQGGMGLVYRAQQEYPRRIVALKVMKAASTPGHAKRFEREIAILARLQHPGISQLYSVGEVETQLATKAPFLAMEFVEGVPITEYVARHAPTLRQKLSLMARVCDVVAYAHEQGVIHRDLKPSNILVDAAGEPKVLDFGLATLFADGQHTATTLTEAGQLLGTLDYMSPEQAKGNGADVDQRTDVYALGVLLYELLTGSRPFDLSSCTVIEAACKLQDAEANKLSATSRVFRGDLDTITSKALAKDKLQRYRSSGALAADLRRFLDHEPIHARWPTLAYRTKKFLRRNALFVTSVCLIILALGVGLILAAKEAARANREARTARAQTRETQLQLAAADIAQGDALLQSARFSEARPLYNHAWDILEKAGASTLAAERAVWELDFQSARPIRVLADVAGDVQCAAVSADRRWVALGYGAGRFEVRSTVTNAVAFHTEVGTNIQKVAFSPDSKTVLLVTPGYFEVWNLGARERIRRETLTFQRAVTIGNRFVVNAGSGELRLCSVESDAAPVVVAIPQARDLAAGLSSDAAYAIDDKGNLIECRLDDHAVSTRPLPGPQALRAEFSPDGSKLALLGPGIRVLMLPGLEKAFEYEQGGQVMDAGFADDDSIWVPHPSEPTFDLLRLDGTRLSRLSRPALAQAQSLGALSVLADDAGRLLLWAAPPQGAVRLLGVPEAPTCVALSPDGRVAALGMAGRLIHLMDTVGSHPLGDLPVDAVAKLVKFSPAGNHLVVATVTGHIQVWDLRSLEKVFEWKGPAAVRSFEMDAGARSICATIYGENGARYLSVASGSEVRIDAQFAASGVSISPGGTRCALVGAGCGEIWDVTGKPFLLRQLKGAEEDVQVAFAGEGTLITRMAGTIRRWDAASGELLSSFIGSVQPITSWAVTSSAVVARSRAQLTLLDPADLRQIRRVAVPMEMGPLIASDATGTHILCSGRGQVVFFDWSLPAALRASAAGGPSSGAMITANWAGGSEVPAPQGQAAKSVAYADGLWAAGNVVKAHDVFAGCPGISDGSRALLLRATAGLRGSE